MDDTSSSAAVAGLSVGEVARRCGLTVRTLHHYDDIGLVVADRTGIGDYRTYGSEQLERLQRVVAYRELGFGLDDITRILDDPTRDPTEQLAEQHRLLSERIERLQGMNEGIERALEARTMGINLDPSELLEVFGGDDPSRHADEAEQRWGDTEAYEESKRRTSTYRKDDWLQMKEELEAVEQRLAAAHSRGAPATSSEAMGAAEAHRQHIERWFYPCPVQIHVGLAEMYVSDARFTAHYDQRGPGLAQYVHDAIEANAAARGADG